MNFAYKLDDREATEKLAENLAESILDGNREAVLKLIGEAEEQIDSLPDSMIGLSELHEAGFYSESMLPLTRERAVELHHEGVTIYGLTGAIGGQEQSQRVMNLELDILKHDGLFGVTKFEWENYRRSQEMVMIPEEKVKIKETLLLESDGKLNGRLGSKITGLLNDEVTLADIYRNDRAGEAGSERDHTLTADSGICILEHGLAGEHSAESLADSAGAGFHLHVGGHPGHGPFFCNHGFVGFQVADYNG